MADEHPVHVAVAALTWQQQRRIELTDQLGYTVTAPCPLQQLVDALAVGQEHTGRRTVPGSRPPASTEALDLWHEVLYNVHSWAKMLGIDRRAYRNDTASETPGARDPGATTAPPPAPWWTTLDPEAADVIDPDRLPAAHQPAAPSRHQMDGSRPEIPPVGRLLRAVAAEATTRGLTAVADAVHRNAVRWHRQIGDLLSAVQHQRPLRGVVCTACGADTVTDQGDDAGRPCTITSPAVVLTDDGDGDQWLVCQACGWSCALHTAAINRYCATIRTIAVRRWLLHPPHPLADYPATVRQIAVRLWLLHPPRARQEVPA